MCARSPSERNMEKSSLPIAAFREKILETVAKNAVTIITAETGAGKSTQVPQYLIESGRNIVVTEPRRLAARTVAQRVAEERGESLGGVVGYRTAVDRCDSAATRCLFVTDGLALVRELMGLGRHDTLVLDEVHEWNLNIEVLAAWSKHQIEHGANFRLVLMSATIEAEKLSKFFGGAPVVSVPGRTFPVEERQAGRSIVEDAVSLLRAGRNVLVFQPGKGEIGETVADLEESLGGDGYEIIPLHGELTPEEQARAFRHFSRPKCVVATNVAQTSITIDDIDGVVDSEMERRVELVSGVEGLYLKPISLADREQRKGRAGRTKPGVYVGHCPSSESRLAFPVAEVLRTRLDQTVLRLAEAGIDMEKLAFFHQPAIGEILDAKRALKALGCMDAEGIVTPVGRLVAKMPVSVQFARMVVEADKRGVVDDVVTIAAILEVGEITARERKSADGRGTTVPGNWRLLIGGESESDVLAQLAVYKAAEKMSKSEMIEKGVFVKAFYQAKDARRMLANALRGRVREFRSSGNRTDIVHSVVAGMVDHLYQNRYGEWVNGDSCSRMLARESVVCSPGSWIVGLPFDLQIQTKRGKMTLHLVRMVTRVNPLWLAEAAPQLVKVTRGISPAYDSENDVVTSVTQTFFNGTKTGEVRVSDPSHEHGADLFARYLAGRITGFGW